eukprot:CAMPEP_0172591984 /NCGR_PEP_ID=MMETSP1068-20121228/10878_1 /TAXON_ID=35684 /ORGANISM="Pseudopedinella elastica, Strain CCMP716" /LENGTH=84 /DNA_ID=CAMNT_0013388759 /DNA_START=309 /DNA_END=563 /DNA_ORIENTATION=-
MDETMDDDTKDPEPFQQGGTPAADSEDAIAESMDETMDGDTTTKQTNSKPYNHNHKRGATEKNRRNRRQKAKQRAKAHNDKTNN